MTDHGFGYEEEGQLEDATRGEREALQKNHWNEMPGKCPHLPTCGCKDNECLRLED